MIVSLTDFLYTTMSKVTVNVFGLGDGCEALDCAVGQLAPNPCYKPFLLVFTI